VIRAFIAIEISPATIARIVSAIGELKLKMPGVRWVAPENFHLTVKFLGSIEANRVSALGDALEAVITPFPRCTINAKGLGVFPGLRQPKVLWVGFIGDELTRLAVRVETALLALGIPAEPRGFSPHLTIGRWRQMHGLAGNIKQELQQWRDRYFGTTMVDRVVLFQSELKPAGAVYSQLKKFKLNDQPID
jgi:RNA 2',3'-cyclic 3'-phosphodiesterase